MNNQELKQKVQDFFVKIDDDKFTKVKYIKANHSIKLNYNGLSFSVEYRRKDDVDMIFFIFRHFDKSQLNLRNAKLYIILDDEKTIELSDSSGYKYEEVAGFDLTTIQIAVGVPDFISIVNANKFEYSFRCDDGKIEGLFKKNDKFYLQGFYNATFDDEYELTELSKFIENVPVEVNIWDINQIGKRSIAIPPGELLDKGLQSILWRKITIKGDIIFGWSPNSIDKSIYEVFTTEGIHDSRGNFISYSSKPNFEVKKGFWGTSLVDYISDFKITLVSNSSEQIDLLINFINFKIYELGD